MLSRLQGPIRPQSKRLPLIDTQQHIAQPSRFSLPQRIKIAAIAWVGYWVIAIIGRTIRWESKGSEHLDRIHNSGARAIFTFWHGRIFPATWYWRNRGIIVMTSLNLDGEYIWRCIRRHGYEAARGSSSSAGLRALAEMVRGISRGHDVAFTIDGPRGPRYVAKQGPVILARKTGAAIFCFHIALKHRVQINSWDHFQVPLPFTRAMVFQAEPIWVGPEADVRRSHERVQKVLDELRVDAARWETD